MHAISGRDLTGITSATNPRSSGMITGGFHQARLSVLSVCLSVCLSLSLSLSHTHTRKWECFLESPLTLISSSLFVIFSLSWGLCPCSWRFIYRQRIDCTGCSEQSVLVYATNLTNKRVNARIAWHWDTFAQPLLQWKGNEYYTFRVCVCSLRYPPCNAHTPYCHLWPARLYYIFPHYLINGTIFERERKKELLTIKCVRISSKIFICNISHYKKNWARCDQKNILPPFNLLHTNECNFIL